MNPIDFGELKKASAVYDRNRLAVEEALNVRNAALRLARRQGASLKELATVLGISHQAVAYALKSKHGTDAATTTTSRTTQ